MGKYLIVAALAVVGIFATAASALAACTIQASAVNFGTYDIFVSAPLDSTGTLTIECGNKDKDISITLDRGGAPSFDPRRLLKGSEALNYNLYLDAGRTIIWGDGTGGTEMYFNRNPPNKPFTITIFGRIPLGQGVSAGTYTNTITATINF